MKVLLVPVHLKEHFTRSFPLGLGYVAAYLLKSGHDVRVYDPPPEKEPGIEREVAEFRPDIVGFSCMTPTYYEACELARRVKAVADVPVIFGGIHATALPEETVSNDFIDYVIVGEGEETFKELLEMLRGKRKPGGIRGLVYKRGKKVVVNKPRELIEDLDKLPFPARYLFPDRYFKRCMCIRGMWVKGAQITGSRGCPFNCTYCGSKVMFGRRVRFRSPKNVVDEIEHLVREYGISAVIFADDTFTINKKRAIEICREIKRRNLGIVFSAQARADCVDDEIVGELADAGCVQVDVGVESGSERVLKTLQKGIIPDQVRAAFRLLKKYKLRTCATFMVGNPGETMEDIEKTRKLASDINADYAQFFITTPYPGTPMFKELIKHDGIVDTRSYSVYKGGGENLRSLIRDTIDKEKLIRLQQELNEQFLRGAVSSIMFNRLFLWDTLMLLIQKPSILKKALSRMIKARKMTEFYRTFYYSHDLRK